MLKIADLFFRDYEADRTFATNGGRFSNNLSRWVRLRSFFPAGGDEPLCGSLPFESKCAVLYSSSIGIV